MKKRPNHLYTPIYELNHHRRIDALVMPVFEKKKKKREKECDVRCGTLQAPNFVAAAGAMGTGGKNQDVAGGSDSESPYLTICREPLPAAGAERRQPVQELTRASYHRRFLGDEIHPQHTIPFSNASPCCQYSNSSPVACAHKSTGLVVYFYSS